MKARIIVACIVLFYNMLCIASLFGWMSKMGLPYIWEDYLFTFTFPNIIFSCLYQVLVSTPIYPVIIIQLFTLGVWLWCGDAMVRYVQHRMNREKAAIQQ